MITSEYKGSDNEVIDAYYEIYMYNLDEGFMTLEECEWDLEMLEEEEEYLACAGVFKAMNNHKAIKEERFSDLWLGLNVNTD
jgi:uncharacterized protein YfbU (UPF0304 family)